MSECNMWEIEQGLYDQGIQLVCGVDEAGRGPLAGPVFATMAAPARRSQALTLQPLRDSTPSMTATFPSTETEAPMRFSSPI